MNEGQPVRPANILHIVAINQGKAPLTMEEPVAPAYSPQQVQAVVLVAADEAAVGRALHKLAFLGLDHRVKGSLRGGMSAWISAGMPHATVPQISVTELRQRLATNDAMRVLDVREPDEYDGGHIEGAASMSFKILEEHLDQIGIGAEEEVAVVCAGGVRSGTACSILQRNGFLGVHNVTGGMGAWKAASLPMVTD
jgi:rhodanese-related sulfurtransferase